MEAVKTYRLFLQGIRSENTAVVNPDVWNLFFNNIILKWVNFKQDMVERNQSVEDDLSLITITTDGLPFLPLLPIGSVDGITVFPVPEKVIGNVNNSHVVNGTESVKYPDYLRLLNAKGITEDGTHVPLDSLKTNEEDELLVNKYTKPSIDKCYYRIEDGTSYYAGGRVFKVYHNSIDIKKLRLSYLRKPFKYFFDESRPEDVPSNVNFTVGGGSVPLEFDDLRTVKIVDMAVRLFLEIRGDQRYQTFTNEQVINKIIN